MVRSRLRAAALDPNDSFAFANVTVDGYSGEELNEGYKTGIVLTNGPGGATQLTLYADDGGIRQDGVGDVYLNGNVHATKNVRIDGDLMVFGTETVINTQQMYVEDPITVINDQGSELLSSWTGLSARDSDGYHRSGWVFTGGGPSGTDGYFGLSVAPEAWADAVPTRATAYLGAGDGYGDLSSTLPGNSGASKIGVSMTGGLTYDNVQTALEDIHQDIINATDRTDSNHYTINYNAVPAVDEDTCLIMKGGDGLSLLEGYLCLITDPINGSYFRFKTFKDGVASNTEVVIGTKGSTANVDSYMGFYAGDGANAKSATIVLRGEDGYLLYTADQHYFIGPVNLENNLTVQGDTFFGGDVNITGPLSIYNLKVDGYVISNLLPLNDAYTLGDATHEWLDGYFKEIHLSGEGYMESLHVTGGTFLNDLTVTGDTSLTSLTITDLLTVNDIDVTGYVVSDLLPKVTDAYSLGDPTHEWLDGYFREIHLSGEGYMESLHVTGDSYFENMYITNQYITNLYVSDNFQVDGYVTSNLIPKVPDAYSLGDPTHEWLDGYFKEIHLSGEGYMESLHVTGGSFLNDVDITGTLTITDLDVGGYVISDLLPKVTDAYSLGDPLHEWKDGYFKEIHLSGEGYMESLHVTGPGYFQDLTVYNLLDSYYLQVDGYVLSSLWPGVNDAYSLGDPSHLWLDGYFNFFTPINYSVTNINSLTAHLHGIDDALANITSFKHGAYVFTSSEATSDTLDSARAQDQGILVNVTSYTDAQFRDNVYIYLDGQLLLNDIAKRASNGAVVNDVARDTVTPSLLRFNRNVKKGAVLQIVATM